MTNAKTTKRALLVSSMSILLCFAMLLGTTFAWFTDSVTSANNIIKSGNLDVAVEYTLDGTTWNDLDGADGLFQKGLWEPGHTEVVALKITNKGSLALKYNANMNIVKETTGKTKDGADLVLSDILTVSTLTVEDAGVDPVFGINIAAKTLEKAFQGEDEIAWGTASSFKAGNVLESDKQLFAGSTHYVFVKVDMAETVGNEANHNGTDIPTINFGINVLATQFAHENDSFGNDYDKDSAYPEIASKAWDGTADTSWYDDTKTEFELNSAEQLAGLAELVDAGNTFAGKTVKLGSNINLYSEDANGEPISFDPIGSYRNKRIFEGTFDGQNHTIANMSQNTWALDNGYSYDDLGLGLFGAVENATIKNLVMDNASISGESALCGTIAAVAGDKVTFENIKVTNTEVADYQYYAGGIVGWAGGDEQFINCVIDASTTIGAQWGEFNNANGGVIGGVSTEADVLIKDCTVACRIDAFNDVTSAYEWYSYRRSGMLIGDSGQKDDPDGDNVGNAIAPRLTCENVTVIYGNWANYHYCQFNAMRYPWVRVEAGTSTGAYSNPRYGNPTDANGNKVVDGSHVHNDGEKHNELIVFDQLYGGATGDRYCTYGTATHDGVTVIYNNK